MNGKGRTGEWRELSIRGNRVTSSCTDLGTFDVDFISALDSICEQCRSHISRSRNLLACQEEFVEDSTIIYD